MAADAPAAFFSYCRDDSDFALRLAQELKAAGASVWIDQLDIQHGTHWDRAIEHALNNCSRMLVILSPASVNSDNVRNEITFALNAKKAIIPVLYLDCSIPLQLLRVQYIDFRADFDRSLKALLKTLGVRQLPLSGISQSPARIEIRNLTRRVWPAERHGFTGAEYYVDIRNDGDTESLESVRVELVDLVPDAIGFLPVPLHIKHEDYESREFSVNPKSIRQIDILTGPVNDPLSQKEMIIPHTVKREIFPLPRDKYRMTIRASAGNAPPVEAIFDAWIDKDGELRCVRADDPTPALEAPAAVSASGAARKVWDVESGRTLRTLKGHLSTVNGVAVSGNGRLAVSASADKTLKVWDLDSGRELRTLQGHSAYVNGVAISADGRLAVSASADRTLKVWDVDSGRELHTLKGHSAYVNGVAVSRDGKLAVSASFDNTLKVWDVAGGYDLCTLEGHSSFVRGVAVSADGQQALSGSADKTLKVWDVDSGREVRTLRGHSDRVYGAAVSVDMRRAVSASKDETLKVWDVDSGHELATLKVNAPLLCCAVSSDEKTLVAGDINGVIHYLRLD